MATLDTVIITAKFSICEYIDSVQTLWALANVNKSCSNSLKLLILVRIILDRNLNKLLHKYASSLPCLSKFLNAHQNSVVSGSILLQAFLGEEWEAADLDIYLPFINIAQVTEQRWSLTNGIIRRGASDWGILRKLIGPREARTYLAKYLLFVIETMTYRNKEKVQYMFVDMSLFPAHNRSCSQVTNRFDLSIVQNYYDGNRFHFGHVNDILKRQMHTTACAWVGNKALIRINKYENRGFTYKFTGRKRKYISKATLAFLNMRHK